MHNTKRNIFNILIPIILGSFATGAIADLPAGRYGYTAPEPTSMASSSVTEYKKNELKWHDENAGSPEFTEKDRCSVILIRKKPIRRETAR